MNLMPKTSPPCPLCANPSRRYARLGDRFYGVTARQVDLFLCAMCGLCFQYPIPDRKTLAGFYPQGYWREDAANASWLARMQRVYVRALLEWDLMAWFRKLALTPGQRHLDLGCGRGDFLARIGAHGIAVQGVESDDRAVSYARNRFGLAIEQVDLEDWLPPADRYDAISAFHVVEHVRHPRELLERCHRALRHDGRLLLRVPNLDSVQAHVFGRGWKGLEVPRHVHNFSARALDILLEQCGFVVARRSTWSWRDGPPGWTSSMFPGGEPTRQAVLGKRRPIAVLGYLALTWMVTPIEGLSAVFDRGGMATVLARKAP